MQKSGQMVFKGGNCVHNDEIRLNGLERSQLGTQYKNQMVLKGVNWAHNDKIRSNDVERSNLGTQYRNQVIWSWKDQIVPNWLLSRPFDVIFALCTQLTPFKTI